MTADHERHGPEIEAIAEGMNGILFHSDDVADLAQKLRLMIRDREAWRQKGEAIRSACAARYSIDSMARTIGDVLASNSLPSE